MQEKTVSILNTRAAPHTLPSIFDWEVKNGRNVKTKRRHKGLILKPGPNKDVVSEAYWAEVKPKLKAAIKAGWLDPITADEEVPEKFDPGAQIKFQSVPDALIAIKECEDLELLQAWHEKDQRAEVKEAVQARLRVMIDASGASSDED